MTVLFIFYFIYTLYSAWLDSNADEQEVIRNCTCKDSHKAFYTAWLIICFTLWLIFHSLCTLADSGISKGYKIVKPNIAIQVHNCVGYFGISKGDENDSGEEDSPERKLKK